MIAKFAIVVSRAAVIILALAFSCAAHADERYPTVKQIEAGLASRSDSRGAISGAPLPFMIPALGRGWTVYYVRGHYVGQGEYDVRIRLR